MLNKLNISFLIIAFSLLNTALTQNQITGFIKDSESQNPLEFAQAAIFNASDSSMVTGATASINGEFVISTQVTGKYLLRLSFIGYQESWIPVNISRGENDLGIYFLAPTSQQLSEVQVTAAAMLFRTEADRRIFNVEQMTVAEGGTAIQLLETLPSVQVDEEGRISMRGSGNILIYINGRPTNLTSDDSESILEQYPANAIKEVEYYRLIMS